MDKLDLEVLRLFDSEKRADPRGTFSKLVERGSVLEGLLCRRLGDGSLESAKDVAHADSLDGWRLCLRGKVADLAELNSELS